MATRVRLKRYRAIIILSILRRCVSFFLVIYSVLVARAAVTRFPSMQTHTRSYAHTRTHTHTYTYIHSQYIHHLSLFHRLSFSSSWDAPIICMLINHVPSCTPSFFFFFFIKSVIKWIFIQQSTDTFCDIIAIFQASFGVRAWWQVWQCIMWRWRWRWWCRWRYFGDRRRWQWCDVDGDATMTMIMPMIMSMS